MLGHYKSGYAAYVDAGEKAFAQRTVLLHNRGEGRFEEWPDPGDLGRLRMAARGTAVADLDGDGALDLVIVDLNGPVRVLKNTAAAGRSWIEIEPRPGADRNTVMGTRVRVTAGGRVQAQTYRTSASYASGSLVPLHFGLGAADAVERIEVRWPSGKAQSFLGVAARRVYAVVPGGELEPAGVGSRPSPR